MKRILGVSAVVLAVALFFMMLPPRRSAAARHQSVAERSAPIVTYPVASDISLPVSEYPRIAPSTGRHRVLEHERRGRTFRTNQPDTVFQDMDSSPLQVAATLGLNFAGINDRDGVAPPDTNASVGSTEVVETVNLSYQVYNKTTGASIFGPAEINSIFTGLGGSSKCGKSGINTSDPVVLYDKAAGRWLITIIAFNNNFQADECIAVSTSSLAEGSYARYDFSFGNLLNDYPKFGVWPDAYYAAYNTFNPGSDACAYDRATMLAGGSSPAQICFQRGGNDFSFMPSDLDGSTQPPPGEPNFYVALSQTSATKINLYKFHVDFVTPPNSTFTGPTQLTVAAFTNACGGSNCIPQSGTTQTLDSLADRVMFRLAYRNFGDHEALVINHSVRGTATASGARWYEIRSPNATPVIFQQGTVGSATLSFWMGSIAMDKVGDIALGFSASSSTTHPSIRFTGRIPTDPLGRMESVAGIKQGNGSQNGGLCRWGDYSSMSIDPVDDCTFWYAQEYIPSNGSFNWNTQLANFKFTACH